MNLKKFNQFEKYESPWDEEDESYYNDDQYLFGRPYHSNKDKGKSEEEEEEDEYEDIDDDQNEDIQHLMDLLRTYFENQGVEVDIENKGLDITISTYLNKVEKLKNIIKVFNIVKKVKKDILPQYESEFELWETKDKSPVLYFSFYYEGDFDDEKPF
jgi:hypothetical protein